MIDYNAMISYRGLNRIGEDRIWDGILAAYGEIALKSDRVRSRFVSKLKNNISEAFKTRGFDVRVRHRWSRILVDNIDDIDAGCRIASRIFGLKYIAPYKYIDLDDLESFIRSNVSILLDGAKSFAVRVRRTGIHSFTSRDIESRIGGIVKASSNLKVNLDNPDRTIHIEIHDDECYVYTDRIDAPGGLPLGTSSRIVSLVSGGIDSPVATWLMMKRGCPATILFAYFPLGGDESDLRRFLAVARILRDWHIGEEMKIYSYRHDYVLKEIRRVADSYTCVLCRRMMYRVACRVERGEFFGLLGPNGAGKTTLIKMLCTIILPTEGTAKVNGYDIIREPVKVRSSIGWFHGETGGRSLYWRLNAEDNLRFYAYLQNIPKDIAEKRIDALLEFFGLSKERKKLVKDYSTGMKVRVMLARALLHNPPILLMDEPTIGLDTVSAVETRNLLKALNRELGKTILFTSHNMFEVEQLCERIAIMKGGSIIVDASPSVLRDMLRDIHSVEVEVRGVDNLQELIKSVSNLSIVRRIVDVKNDPVAITLRLQVDDEYEAIPLIADRLYRLGVKVSSIRRSEPTLEDIFVKLAKGEPA